jgi:hypothetical protein
MKPRGCFRIFATLVVAKASMSREQLRAKSFGKAGELQPKDNIYFCMRFANMKRASSQVDGISIKRSFMIFCNTSRRSPTGLDCGVSRCTVARNSGIRELWPFEV